MLRALYCASPSATLFRMVVSNTLSPMFLSDSPDVHVQLSSRIVFCHEVTENPDLRAEFSSEQADDIMYLLDSFHGEIVPVRGYDHKITRHKRVLCDDAQ